MEDGLGSTRELKAGARGAGTAAKVAQRGMHLALMPARIAAAPASVPLFKIGLIAFVAIAILTAVLPSDDAAEASQGYPAGSDVPKELWPIYESAASYYKVSPYLLAAVNKVESDFGRSTLTGVRSDGNECAAAGPMQFGIDGVEPYGVSAGPGCNAGPTWQGYWKAFIPIKDARPASYPLQRSSLPACRRVPDEFGCVYDSFDAVAGAAMKLSSQGADTSLDSAGTHQALLGYNADEDYVSKVLGYARNFESLGATAITAEPGSAPNSGGARAIVEAAAALVGAKVPCYDPPAPPGTKTCIASAFRPNSTTTSGSSSDHSSNDAQRAARDIAVPGVDAITGPPAPELDRAAVAIGHYFGRNYKLGATIDADTFDWHGYRIQIIWRTPAYGGHMGHIHVGACRGC